MRDWQETTLNNISEIVAGYAFKSTDFSDEGDELVIKIKDIQEPFVNTKSATKVFFRNYSRQKLEKFKITKGDFVIAMTGATIGKIGRYVDSNYAYINQRVAKFEARKCIEKSFIYYIIQHQDFKNHVLNNIDSQSAQGNISATSIGRYPLLLPSIEEQKAIAAVLGALDDKIELNRRMNATLEAMVRALFKSWFVDFDPVRFKMEGKQPFGMDAATAALFPSRLVPSPLGDIPEGWETGRLLDILELLYGKSLTKEDRQNGPYPVYGSGGVTGYNNQALVNGPGIVVGRKGTVGSLYWEDRDFFPIDTVFFAVPKQYFSLVYIFSQLECLGLENMNTDAAVPGLNRENAYRLDIVKPSQSILTAYTSIASEIRGKIRANNSEIEKLVKSRDYLLPKLISGDIRIPDVEKFLEAA